MADKHTAGAVLITGCSSGIGRATAEHLAERGHTVYATARKLEAVRELEAKGCRTLALDVTDEASMQAAVKAVEDAEGAVGALVNNAGYSQSGAVESVKMDDVRAQFETNVFGLIRMSQLVLPGMRAKGAGRIVNVGSMGGKLTFPGRWHLPRDQVRGRGDQRRDALRGPRLRRGRGPDRARPDQDGVRLGGGQRAAFRHHATMGPTGSSTRPWRRGPPGAYEGPTAKLGGGPETVAKAIEKAIVKRRPKARYPVTPSARLLIGQRALFTDGMWDRFVGSQFPRPGVG